MPKYKKVNYKRVCDMVKKVATIKGEPQPLRLLVDDLSRHMGLGIDTIRVKNMLGDKVVAFDECTEDGVFKTTVLVIP